MKKTLPVVAQAVYQSEFENCYSFPIVRASAKANRSTVVG